MHNNLVHIVEGNQSGPTLVFIHGWPDNADLWNDQVKLFSNDFRCIRITLPLFGNSNSFPDNGFDFPELVELIHQTIEATSPKQKVTLIGHDWGAWIAYLFETKYSFMVEKLVTLDVGSHLMPSSPGQAIFLVSYQWWLILAWWVGKVLPAVGDFMSRTFALLAKAPHPKQVRAKMNYLYFYIWRAILNPSYRKGSRPKRPKCPHLFLFGEKKFYHFHSKKFELDFKSRSDWKIVAIPNAGHWLMLDQPELTFQTIYAWLMATKL